MKETLKRLIDQLDDKDTERVYKLAISLAKKAVGGEVNEQEKQENRKRDMANIKKTAIGHMKKIENHDHILQIFNDVHYLYNKEVAK